MTTIVGIRTQKGFSHLAADTLLTSRETRVGTMDKLIEIESVSKEGTDTYQTCIGVAGPATCITALRSILEESRYSWKTTLDVYENMLALHCELRDQHGLRVVTEEDAPFEDSQFTCLVANRYGLWKVLSYREVIPISKFAALGSGREFAIGALEALGTTDPEASMRRAITIAAHYDLQTNGESTIWASKKDHD